MKRFARPKLAPGQLRNSILALLLSAFAAYLRFYRLGQLPPGLHPLEAALGIKAQGSVWPGFSQIQNVLAVLTVKLTRTATTDPILALRAGVAAISLAGIYFFYLTLKRLFDRQTAVVGATLAIVTPWALHLDRFGGGYALALTAMALSLYLLVAAWQDPKPTKIILAFAATALGLYTSSVYNWYVLALALIAAIVFPQIFRGARRGKLTSYTIGILVFLLLAAPAGPAALSFFGNAARHLPGRLLAHLASVITMFNVKTPQSFEFNLASLPLLNAFVGLMFILGGLVTLTQLKHRAHRVVLGLMLVALTAAVISSGNLADQTTLLLWPTFALAAVGVNYLLTQWLRTFPQNSAARNIGGLMLVVLLLLSARQGYNQYFLAWPATTQTKLAYHAPTLAELRYETANRFYGQTYLVGNADDLAIASYLRPQLKTIAPTDIANLPKASAPTRFIIGESVKGQTFAALAKHFTGGKLAPQNDSTGELFLVYTLEPKK